MPTGSLYTQIFPSGIQKNNVFPAYENNQLVVKNMADTRYKGFELQLRFNSKYSYSRKFNIANSISFYKFSNIVTSIRDGYDNHPIAGFSTVYKALVKGQPVGVIIGTIICSMRPAGN